MSKRVGLVVVIFFVLVLVLAGVYYYSYSQPAKQPIQTQAPVSHVSPTIAPPKLDVGEGTITALSGGVMTVQTASGSATFNISHTGQILRLISGVFGSGKVATASAGELKVGQQIHYIGSGGSATAVVIIK